MLPALTGVRFVLALWVIVYHLTTPGMLLGTWAQGLPADVLSILRTGYVAVGSFFVLSGFVLAHSYAANSWNVGSLRRYAANRIARIYPVYLLSLLIVLPFALFENVPGKPGLILNYVLVLQGWSDKLAANWNTPAWSLSCEIFFYLCFPLALVAMRKPRWIPAIAVMTVACFLPNMVRHAGTPETAKPLLHLADFLAGIAASHVYTLLARRRFEGRGAWFYIPAVLLAPMVIARQSWLPDSFPLDSALRPLNCALLIGLALGGGLLAAAFAHARVVFLGKASYAMYILHIPLLWWYKFIYVTSFINGLVSSVLYVAFVTIVASLVHVKVEEPWNIRLRTFLTKGRTMPRRFSETPVRSVSSEPQTEGAVSTGF